MEMISKMPPQVGLMLLDLAVESMDLPNREEIAKRIRAQTGMKDPDQKEPTPEEMQQADAQAKQQQAQEAMFMAELDGKVADADKKKADAQRAMASAERELGLAMKDRVDATGAAMVAAQAVITMPTIARVADGILQEAGWQNFNATAMGGLPPMPPQQPQPEPQQEMMQQPEPQTNTIPADSSEPQ